MTFKVGDKIKRVGKCLPGFTSEMKEGNIYTIKKFYRGYGCVELYEAGRGWLLNNFIKVEDDFPELLKKAKIIRELGDKLL